ncbi:DUF4435 domain-containing protein [Falsihalocynthiibacter sp. S25ZX9]|uniref:DUF4435 domain-containing protein n=1 Tax=Falsihalocynthiibacter sp. S25ZX9 TaxID=3240870 RepID=UPI00350F2E29
MTTSVVYPPRAAQALGYLNSSNNDIEIFVEDSSAPNLWIKLLRKLLPPNVRLNNVSILGSRENVLAACRADQANDGRKKLYIIDADLDLLKGHAKPRLKHLYRLRAYCVENYLLDNDSLIDLATTFDPDISELDANRKLDFNGWLAQNERNLRALFVCYAVTHKLLNSEQTVRYSVNRLLEDGCQRNNLCSQKTSQRIFRLYRKIATENFLPSVRLERQNVVTNSSAVGIEVFVSGKDYILPQVYGLMKSYFGLNMSIKQFKVMLAGLIGKNADPYLARRLNNICR